MSTYIVIAFRQKQVLSQKETWWLFNPAASFPFPISGKKNIQKIDCLLKLHEKNLENEGHNILQDVNGSSS